MHNNDYGDYEDFDDWIPRIGRRVEIMAIKWAFPWSDDRQGMKELLGRTGMIESVDERMGGYTMRIKLDAPFEYEFGIITHARLRHGLRLLPDNNTLPLPG